MITKEMPDNVMALYIANRNPCTTFKIGLIATIEVIAVCHWKALLCWE
jgi:hypothetical protein